MQIIQSSFLTVYFTLTTNGICNNCKITFGVDSKFSRVLECLEYYAYHARIWAYYQSLAGSIECKGCGLFDGKWESYISQVL